MINLGKEFVENRMFEIAPVERLQLCYNVLPNGMSYFHHLDEVLLQDEKMNKVRIDKVAKEI